jgi:hypothetical protein
VPTPSPSRAPPRRTSANRELSPTSSPRRQRTPLLDALRGRRLALRLAATASTTPGRCRSRAGRWTKTPEFPRSTPTPPNLGPPPRRRILARAGHVWRYGCGEEGDARDDIWSFTAVGAQATTDPASSVAGRCPGGCIKWFCSSPRPCVVGDKVWLPTAQGGWGPPIQERTST